MVHNIKVNIGQSIPEICQKKNIPYIISSTSDFDEINRKSRLLRGMKKWIEEKTD